MRRFFNALALPAFAGLVLIGGVTVAPDDAEARRLGRAVGTAVAVGTVKAVTRRANAADRRRDQDRDEDGDERVGARKPVDYEARTREAQAKLAAERAPAVAAAAAPPSASGATAAAIETRKVVCVAGC